MNEFILLPTVGAIIGALTNDLAIRMLFRPYTEKFFCGIRIPMTPGLIPKQRTKIAKNIAEVFEKHLLSNAELHELLSSDKVKASLEESLSQYIQHELDIKPFLEKKGTQEQIGEGLHALVTNFAPQWIDEVISEEAPHVADKMVDNALASLGPLAMLAGGLKPKIVEKIITGVQEFSSIAKEKLNDDKVKEKLQASAIEEIQNIDLKPYLLSFVPELAQLISSSIEIAMQKATADGTLDIGKKIEDKINSLPVSHLEEIILGFSREQFKYITIFGAFLGGMIGLGQALALHYL